MRAHLAKKCHVRVDSAIERCSMAFDAWPSRRDLRVPIARTIGPEREEAVDSKHSSLSCFGRIATHWTALDRKRDWSFRRITEDAEKSTIAGKSATLLEPPTEQLLLVHLGVGSSISFVKHRLPNGHGGE